MVLSKVKITTNHDQRIVFFHGKNVRKSHDIHNPTVLHRAAEVIATDKENLVERVKEITGDFMGLMPKKA